MTVYVHGPSGIGKTSFVHEFLSEVGLERKALVLEGRCYEHELVPYRALDSFIDALARYLRRLSSVEAERIIPTTVGALARVFPVFETVDAVDRVYFELATPPLDPREMRNRAVDALCSIIARLCERTPVVLFIDDLQWGDIDSAAMLNDVLDASQKMALLGGAGVQIRRPRNEPMPEGHFVRRYPARLPGGERVEAGGVFSADEAAKLSYSSWSAGSAGSVGSRRRLIKMCCGSPPATPC